MNIQLLSDLHLEFYPRGYLPTEFISNADVLVIAGDMAVGPKDVEFYLRFFATHYNHVIYVLGNHEAYGHSLQEFDYLEVPANVHFLNPGCIKLGDTTFIGGTLWTDFRNNKASEKVSGKYITDFKRIQGFTTQKAKELYNYHHEYILKAVQAIPGKKVIITHFLPGKHCISPQYLNKGYPTDELNAYFAPEPVIPTTEVSHWLFGHTHDSVDTTINNTRYLANPYGYLGHELNHNFHPRLQL